MANQNLSNEEAARVTAKTGKVDGYWCTAAAHAKAESNRRKEVE